MPQLAIIADDMTGAADAGAAFAQAGLVTILALSGSPLPSSDVAIISTESRHLPPEMARASVRQAVPRIADARWIYKKIDSTLRGNPGVELEALLDALGAGRCLIAPAFPSQGRTTCGGQQMVNGVALAETAFAAEAPNSDLCTIFTQASKRTCRLVSLDIMRRGLNAVCAALTLPGLCIADAETDADLDLWAEAVMRCGLRVCCGSAGLARALVNRLPLRRAAIAPALPSSHGGSKLVVAGSRSQRTLRQVQDAAAGGAALIAPDQRFMEDPAAFAALVDDAVRHLAAGRHTILTTVALPDWPAGAEAVAGRLAEATRAIAGRHEVGGLVLTGGDIAGAVFQALHTQALWLHGEIEPGVPSATLLGGLLSGTPVVTKAGGFGSDQIIAVSLWS